MVKQLKTEWMPGVLWRLIFGKKCKNCEGKGTIVVWDSFPENFFDFLFDSMEGIQYSVWVCLCPICRGRGRI